MSSTALVPMIEVYSNAMYEVAIAGLNAWYSVPGVRQAVVLVSPAMILDYWPRFKAWEAAHPKCELIPGAYTNQAIGGSKFANLSGWKRVRLMFQQFKPRCAIFIDHELALRAYLSGEYMPDWTAYRDSLRQMLSFSEVWWYPTIEGDEARQKRYIELLRNTQRVLGYRVRGIDHAWAGYHGGGPGSTGSVACRKALDDTMLNPPINIVYTLTGPQFWPDAEVPRALDLAYSSTVILYPGSGRFVQCGEAMQTVLAAGQPTADEIRDTAAAGRGAGDGTRAGRGVGPI